MALIGRRGGWAGGGLKGFLEGCLGQEGDAKKREIKVFSPEAYDWLRAEWEGGRREEKEDEGQGSDSEFRRLDVAG